MTDTPRRKDRRPGLAIRRGRLYPRATDTENNSGPSHTDGTADMDGHRVLVVEDECTARETLHIILASHRWTVSEAATVAEGLAQLDPPPDCIILDLDLPDGPGEAVLRRVREANLWTRVTITTGCDDAA